MMSLSTSVQLKTQSDVAFLHSGQESYTIQRAVERVQMKGFALMGNTDADIVDQMKCRVCGEQVRQLYQQQTCKKCLVQSFQKLVRVIDHFRSGAAGDPPGG